MSSQYTHTHAHARLLGLRSQTCLKALGRFSSYTFADEQRSKGLCLLFWVSAFSLGLAFHLGPSPTPIPQPGICPPAHETQELLIEWL